MDKRLEFLHYLCPVGENITVLAGAGVTDAMVGASGNALIKSGADNSRNVVCSLASSRLPDFVINNSLRKNGLEVSSSYLVVPGFSNPRWFLPNNRTIIKNSGNIVKPSSFKGRTAWSLTKLMNSIGIPQAIFPDRLIIASKSDSKVPSTSALKELLAAILKKESSEFIIYNGSQNYYQKSTVQIMDHNGVIIAYAKIGSTDQARARIEAEGIALKDLTTFYFSKLNFPEVISIQQLNGTGATILVQTPPPEGYSEFKRILDDRHIDALVELFLKTRKALKGDEIVSGVMEKIKTFSADREPRRDAFDLMDKAALILAPQINGMEIMTGTSHGDFTPWNTYLNSEGLFAFDWELSAPRLPLWDVYNFILHSEVLIFGRNAADLFRMLLSPNGKYTALITRYESSTSTPACLHRALLLSWYLLEILIYYTELSSQQENSGLGRDHDGETIIRIASSLLKITLGKDNDDR
jgi:hypothetical protein